MQALGDPTKLAEAAAAMNGPSAKAYADVDDAVQAWWNYNLEWSNGEATSSKATYTNARLVLVAMVAAAPALGGAAAWLITRSITGPIGRAVQVATTVAAGDLSSRIVVRGKDETARRLQALATMNDSPRCQACAARRKTRVRRPALPDSSQGRGTVNR